MLRKGLVIYEPKGRAGEYCPLALNLYRGCGHGCIYCYGPDTLHMGRPEFLKAAPRQGIIEKLQKDAPTAMDTLNNPDIQGMFEGLQPAAEAGATGNVWLCVTSDSYQPIDEIHQLTRQAIIILHGHGFNVTILTKAGKRAQRDFDLLGPGDQFAVTLTCTSEELSKKWEPRAALPRDRIDTLKKAHDRGIYTWVSIEPVLYPEESLELIRMTHPFVDEYKLGILNHHPHAATINWREYGATAIELVRSLGKKLYIKRDLSKLIKENPSRLSLKAPRIASYGSRKGGSGFSATPPTSFRRDSLFAGLGQ